MIRRFGTVVVVAWLLAGCAALRPQRPDTFSTDLVNPEFLEQYAATRRFSAGRPGSIKVLKDGSAVLFLRSGPRNAVQDLYEFDVATGQERVLLTADQILKGAEENLSVEEKARRERMRVSARGIAGYQLSKDNSRILVPLSGRLYVIERKSGAVKELASESGYPIDPRFSPDGRSIACVRNNDLYVLDIESGEETRLTAGATSTLSHGTAEFVAQEEMDRREGYWWSPDSESIVYQETSTDGVELFYIADARHPEAEPQPWPYPRPGKKNADVRLGIIPATGGETRWITWDQERYPYLASVNWKEKAPLTILVQNRRQTEETLLAVEAESGSTSLLLTEKDEAWINLDPSMPHWLPDGDAFLWTTERNGSWQLELRARDGRLMRPLTPTSFGYRGLAHVDGDRRTVFLSASDDPTQSHLYRLDFGAEGSTPQRMTEAPGSHSATFSETSRVFVHSGSTLAGQRFQMVRDVDGREYGALKSVAEPLPWVPKIEVTTVSGSPTFHAVLVRPRDFNARRRYPVIVSVYGGPHAQTASANPFGYVLQQWIADQGFIVVSLDGRGTPNRGREWERVIKGNLIDIPLADQVAGLRALGAKYGELDLNRVGIYGWSFGGYFSAMAVMQRPDVYHVGVAGAPVADWLDYDTHYTERYMDLPDNNATGYEASSVLTHAPKLERPLLIIHGTADDNVYFTHSLRMSDALFRAGRPHTFLPLSDFTHMVADPLVNKALYGRIVSFLRGHLAE